MMTIDDRGRGSRQIMTIVDMRILDKRTGRAAGAKKNLSLKYKATRPSDDRKS